MVLLQLIWFVDIFSVTGADMDSVSVSMSVVMFYYVTVRVRRQNTVSLQLPGFVDTY